MSSIMPFANMQEYDDRVFLAIAMSDLTDRVTPVGAIDLFAVVQIEGEGFNGKEVTVELSIMREALPILIGALQVEEARIERSRKISAGDTIRMRGEQSLYPNREAEVLSVLHDGMLHVRWSDGYHNILHRDRVRKVERISEWLRSENEVQ